MENQHRHIKGYRDLSQFEIDLMNKIKAHGEATERLINEVRQHLSDQVINAENARNEEKSLEIDRLDAAQPHRWLSMARTDLQTGLMKMVRAVAQPTSF